MEILEIANKIKQKGGKLYLVGGALRDELLKRKVHDKDYCVVGLNEEESGRNCFQKLINEENFLVYIISKE